MLAILSLLSYVEGLMFFLTNNVICFFLFISSCEFKYQIIKNSGVNKAHDVFIGPCSKSRFNNGITLNPILTLILFINTNLKSCLYFVFIMF